MAWMGESSVRGRLQSLCIRVDETTDVKKASSVILDQLSNIEKVKKKPEPYVLFHDLGDASLNLEVRYWTDPALIREAYESTDQVYRTVVPALIGAGVALPVPTYRILLDRAGKRLDG